MIAALVATLALTVTVQGDSLTVPSAQHTNRSMPNHHIYTNALGGMPTTWGLRNLRSLKKDGRIGNTVVFALGTNDDQGYPQEFEKRIKQVRKIIGKRRCLVIPSIYANGPARRFNKIIHKYADVISPWVWKVTSGKVKLADGVHPATYSGEKVRGQMIAKSIRDCEKLNERRSTRS